MDSEPVSPVMADTFMAIFGYSRVKERPEVESSKEAPNGSVDGVPGV